MINMIKPKPNIELKPDNQINTYFFLSELNHFSLVVISKKGSKKTFKRQILIICPAYFFLS